MLKDFFKKKLKYVIIGAGSTGATFACFLKSAGKNITLISKYESVIKNAKEKNGIRLISTVKGDKRYKINIKTESQYKDKADLIILCIRTPDILSTIPFIKRISHPKTIVTSISNGFGIGYALEKKLNSISVLDSTFVGKCRWYNRDDVEYLQQREYVEFQFAPRSLNTNLKILEKINEDFTQTGMDTHLITDKQFTELAFERLITRSPFEACCIYYNINAHQITDEKRVTFEKLCNELLILAKAMNINVREGFLQEYYSNFEKYKERDEANVYSSILHDINIGQISEIDFLFFIVIALAKEYKIELPTYFMIGEKFKQYNSLDKFIGIEKNEI